MPTTNKIQKIKFNSVEPNSGMFRNIFVKKGEIYALSERHQIFAWTNSMQVIQDISQEILKKKTFLEYLSSLLTNPDYYKYVNAQKCLEFSEFKNQVDACQRERYLTEINQEKNEITYNSNDLIQMRENLKQKYAKASEEFLNPILNSTFHKFLFQPNKIHVCLLRISEPVRSARIVDGKLRWDITTDEMQLMFKKQEQKIEKNYFQIMSKRQIRIAGEI